MVQAGKELGHVALEHVTEPPGIGRGPLDRRMGALALPAGVGVVQEAPFEDRLDHPAERMVDDAVPKGRRADQACPLLRKEG